MRASRLPNDELADALVARPQVHHLDERLVVQRALFERNVFETVAFVDHPRDLRRDLGEHFGRQHVGQTDEAVVAKAADRGVVERVRRVELAGRDGRHGRASIA